MTTRRTILAVPALAALLAACGSDSPAGEEVETGNGAASEEVETGNGAAGEEVENGNGASGERDIDRSVPYLELPSPGDDGPVVDLLIDFRCPPCKGFVEEHGEDIAALVEEGAMTLRLHPRPMLDARRDSDYSETTAAALTAVYAQDPELVLPVEKALFAIQAPDGDTPDPSTEDILQVVRDEGGDDTAIAQIQDGTYRHWLHDVVEANAKRLEVGTPTLYIDGELWEGDWTQPGSVREAITSA